MCLGSVYFVVFLGGGRVCSILLSYYRFARCFVTMVMCIFMRLMFICCSVMMYVFVLLLLLVSCRVYTLFPFLQKYSDVVTGTGG